jgi:hypothetical protein
MALRVDRRVGGWDRPVFSLVPLEKMRGPLSGFVRLPLTVHSSGAGPAEEFDFADPRSRLVAYQIVMTDGDADDAARLINADELLRLWPKLWLPMHVRRAWEPLISQRLLDLAAAR